MNPRYISRAYIVPAHDISCRAQAQRIGRAALFLPMAFGRFPDPAGGRPVGCRQQPTRLDEVSSRHQLAMCRATPGRQHFGLPSVVF